MMLHVAPRAMTILIVPEHLWKMQPVAEERAVSSDELDVFVLIYQRGICP